MGLIILRGENVVSMAVEGPPPPSNKAQKVGTGGPGMARGVGRGSMPVPPTNMPVPPVGAPMGKFILCIFVHMMCSTLQLFIFLITLTTLFVF